MGSTLTARIKAISMPIVLGDSDASYIGVIRK